jgi:hypothetical protein
MRMIQAANDSKQAASSIQDSICAADTLLKNKAAHDRAALSFVI